MSKQRNLSSMKIFCHLNHIKDLMEYKRCHPICLEIHPTNVCSHNCLNCTSMNIRNSDGSLMIDGESLKSTLLEFKNGGGKSVLWSGGGDPSLYYCKKSNLKFLDLIQYADSIGLEQGLYTNGEFLDSELIEEVIKSFTFVRFSLDAFTYKTHKKIHRTESFNKIINHIDKAIEFKKNLGAKIDIGISYVVYDNNILDLRFTTKWLGEHKPDYIYFKPGVLRRPDKFSSLKQNLALYYIKLILRGYRGNKDIEIALRKFHNIIGKTKEVKRSNCYIGSLFPTLSSDGCLYYCCHTVGNRKFLVGNTKNSSLDNIIENFNCYVNNNYHECPVNCRGHIINSDVDTAIELLDNKHINFL